MLKMQQTRPSKSRPNYFRTVAFTPLTAAIAGPALPELQRRGTLAGEGRMGAGDGRMGATT